MDIAPKAGMWVTQNLISHQGDYFIHHIKGVEGNMVTIDVSISIKKGQSGVWGSNWKTNFNHPEGVHQFHKAAFRKQYFQVMKRPSPEIRRAAVKILFGDKR